MKRALNSMERALYFVKRARNRLRNTMYRCVCVGVCVGVCVLFKSKVNSVLYAIDVVREREREKERERLLIYYYQC